MVSVEFTNYRWGQELMRYGSKMDSWKTILSHMKLHCQETHSSKCMQSHGRKGKLPPNSWLQPLQHQLGFGSDRSWADTHSWITAPLIKHK